MQMSKYFICCEKCFEMIGKRNTRAARCWMDFCAHYLEHGEVIFMKNKDFPELRILELMGFLISTDNKDGTAICVKGHMNTEDGEHFFCVKDGCHE